MLKSRRGWSIALVFSLLAAVLIALPQLNRAEAANAGDWDAGYIISDENFYNGVAMTSADQVQSFLQTKNKGCVAGATCILNYAEPTPTMGASAYCDRIDGRANESAASIIHRVGQACNISQMALIVLLEKEQSLVTAQNPTSRQFTAATGYACPDTAPCDAGFGGFFTQVYYGARAYQYYKTHPTQYRHIAGQMNTVLYNPKSSCGSSQVFIQNNATAGLYNYTPYQPNTAALNNLYGSGDTCSAYGNRNFWRLYTDWFGDPRAPQIEVGQPIQNATTGAYYVYSEDAGMVRVTELHLLASMGMNKGIRSMSSEAIERAGIANVKIDTWGMQCGNDDYFISNKHRHRFESAEVRDHYDLSFVRLPADLCSLIPVADGRVSQAAVDVPGKLWIIADGAKTPATQESLAEAGLGDSYRLLLPNAYRLSLPTLEPAPEPTPPVEPEPTEPEPTEPEPTQPVEPEPTDPVDPTPTDPVEPEPTEPEPTDPVEPEPSEPVEPEPSDPTEPEPTPTDPVEPEPTDPVDPTPTDPEPTHPVEPEPTEPEAPVFEAEAGDVIISSDSGGQFVYAADHGLIRVAHQRYLDQLGLDGATHELSAAEIAELDVSTTVLDSWVLRCGDTAYLAVDGQLHTFPRGVAGRHFVQGVVELPSVLCEQLTIAENGVAQLVRDQSGRFWSIKDGYRQELLPSQLIVNGFSSHGHLQRVPVELVNGIRFSTDDGLEAPRPRQVGWGV